MPESRNAMAIYNYFARKQNKINAEGSRQSWGSLAMLMLKYIFSIYILSFHLMTFISKYGQICHMWFHSPFHFSEEMLLNFLPFILYKIMYIFMHIYLNMHILRDISPQYAFMQEFSCISCIILHFTLF